MSVSVRVSHLVDPREMPYLQACIRESLRVNTPLTYVVPRVAMKDAGLVGANGRKVLIPEGSSIIINITCIHYKEEYWPNAHEFNPERFMGMSKGQETECDTTQWLPFGLGSRMCPARNFAMYEQRVLAAMLLNKWEWTISSDSPHVGGIKNGFSPVRAFTAQESLPQLHAPRPEIIKSDVTPIEAI
ncbi:Cytochrome P450 [Mycena sanguinolenta]|uniref:Cytochrome P450 n=1 Tax=Mycena sanguinolenta TaxID=230812 RepID=A0A8H7CRW5_9AGAR|nr:Cytochrome P450 [Mycena sanguinolenta]